MYFKSKKVSLFVLAITSIVCSKVMFFFFNDPEGPNLLIVLVMAGIIYALSLTAYIYNLLPVSFTHLKRLLVVVFIQILIATAFYFCMTYFPPVHTTNQVEVNNSNTTSITYKNTDYGFNFSLPLTWKGYSIIKETWKGYALKNQSVQSGPKLIIRNPKWTASLPYEDVPILVFTITQWNAYLNEDFAVSAAPIRASELGRNNAYVFALPPRWDYDYSLDFKEAEDIIAGNPLHPFNVGINQ